MMNEDDALHVLVTDEQASITSRMAEAVRPPKSVRVEQQGSSLILWCKDRGKFFSAAGTSGADRYVAVWTEDVDTSTTQGILNGLTRGTVCGDVGRVFLEDKEVPIYITSPRFQNGYFYILGSNSLGDRSIDFAFTGKQGNEVLDDTLPDNVDNFTASESGETVNGTVVSAVAFQYFAPASTSFAGVQFFLENYPNVGEVTEFYVDRYLGPPKGVSNGKFYALPARRPGIGSVVLSNGNVNVPGIGTKFVSQFAEGDLIENLGVQGTVQSVTSDTAMTLAAPWTGSGGTFAPTSGWLAIGQVKIYAVALSKAGTHGDYTKAPSQTMLFDADLSAPLAPTLSLVDLAGGVRVLVTPPAGTSIDTITLYKGKGSGLAFAACTRLYSWPHDKVQASPFLEYPDFDFTSYDKDTGQIYSYYATCINVRGVEGTPSARAEFTARQQASGDTDPSIPGRSGYTNMLYNAMFAGTQAGNVDETDTAQDANLFTFADGGYTPGHAGKPYGCNSGQADGTGRYKGYTRWAGTKTAGAAALASFQNGSEVKLPAPSFGNSCYVFQEIGAWDDGRAQFMKALKNGFVAFQCKLRKSGVIPDGSFVLRIELYNNNVLTGNAPRRYRRSDNVLDYLTGVSADLIYGGSVLLDTWQLFYAIFKLDGSLGTTKQVRFTIEHKDSTVGDIYARDPMVNDGQELGLFTPQMGDPYISAPIPGNPAGTIDGDGHRSGIIKVP